MNDSLAPLLELRAVRFGFPARPEFLGPVDLSIRRGECWAILGPNGAGKTTLLKLLAGLLKPSAGSIRLGGRELAEVSARDRAKRIAFLPQHPPFALGFSVREVVLMGRYPHRSLGLFESLGDYAVCDQALHATDSFRFAHRRIDSLSGGEAQRVHLAAALAQQPELLLLDEPTASLDLHHQMAILDILCAGAANEGLGVVFVTHDINLAAQFCTHVLVLNHGKPVAAGPPEQVIDPDVLAPVYGVPLAALTLPQEPARRLVAVMRGSMVTSS